jgi:hypothetical protein
MFQEVLNDYAAFVNPLPTTEGAGASTPPAAEAAHPEVEGSGVVDMSPSGHALAVPGTDMRPDTGEGVPEVASPDGAGIVIEE